MSTTRQSVRLGLLLLVITTLLLLLGTKMDGPISESQISFGIPSIDPADDGYRNDEDEYLNRRYFRLRTNVVSYDTRETDSEEQTAAGSGSGGVRTRSHVREFKKADAVRCLDALSVKRSRRPMHITFIGDSTVRHTLSVLFGLVCSQLNLNFLKQFNQ
jgi:hypothetical protein